MTHMRNITRFIMRRLATNVTAKLMALFMALALWTYAYTTSYSDPVPVIVAVRAQKPANWDTQVSRSEVRAMLSYPRRFENEVRQAVQSGDIEIRIRPQPAEDGEEQQTSVITLESGALIAPPRFAVKVHSYDPAQVTVTMARQAEKAVDVFVNVFPPLGYSVSRKIAQPAQARITGRKSVIQRERLRSIDTEPIDLSALRISDETWSATREARLVPRVTVDGATYRLASVQPAEVQCEITLVQISVGPRIFRDVPINLMHPPTFPYIVAMKGPRVATVSISGRQDLVAGIERDSISLFVSLTEALGAQTRPIEYSLRGVPDTSALTVRIDPPACQVQVTEAPPD